MTDRNVRILSLDREEAKQVFAKKEPADLREFVEALWQDISRLTSKRNVHLGFDADGYAAYINANPSLDDAAKSLLLRGGRLLPSPEGTQIYLLRPDLVGQLSLAASTIPTLGDLLTAAASRGEAILIVY